MFGFGLFGSVVVGLVSVVFWRFLAGFGVFLGCLQIQVGIEKVGRVVSRLQFHLLFDRFVVDWRLRQRSGSAS